MAKLAFNSFLGTIPSGVIVLHTDGLKQSDGLTGAGYVADQGVYHYVSVISISILYKKGNPDRGVQIFQRSIPLGKGLEVFDAEAIGALEGAKSALASSTTKFATNLWVFLDNLEVASRLLTPFSGSSRAVFDEFLKLEPEWQRRFRLPHITQGEIKVRWVPGHSSIPRNVAADKLANEACHLLLASESPYSNAGLKRWLKSLVPQAAGRLWRCLFPQLETYHHLEINTAPSNPKELRLPRDTLERILAIRSSHGDFADYHERFSHQDANLFCRCGHRRAPLHFFFCHIAKRRARRPQGPPSKLLPYLLGTHNGGLVLDKWSKQTCFYSDICIHDPLPD
ncbi:hypothetical protein K3495_g1143 [Podosphaera aphanis]|nr:hypothetical protein K3495_g1143 [Podosphaera aphanis]